MGFGHRLYKNVDPRASQMKRLCHEVISSLGDECDPTLRPMLTVAMALEEAALQDEYFTSRKLFPNVDFYSGITLTAMGFPTSMFTVLFALGRSVGWVAQWRESKEEAGRRISRPRQMYVGKEHRTFVPMEQRGTGGDSNSGDGDGSGSDNDHFLKPALAKIASRSAGQDIGVVHSVQRRDSVTDRESEGGGGLSEYSYFS
jgi:hypothetical protein